MINSSLTQKGRWRKPSVGEYFPEDAKCDDIYNEEGVPITWQNWLGLGKDDPWIAGIATHANLFFIQPFETV